MSGDRTPDSAAGEAGGSKLSARQKLLRRFAGAAFLFFLLKGLVWLGVAAAAAWAALR